MPVASSAEAQARPIPKPPIRIRSVLLVGLFALAVWSLYPRAVAGWQLHNSATEVADYALCMVGPTGPSLLRDNPTQFRILVRRRLIAASADDRPFQDCAAAAGELTESAEVERAHRARAWDFVEYGGAAADRAERGSRGELQLDDVAVSTRRLAELSRNAWPFVRGGYTRLVKPSTSAKEAVHPSALPRPAIGSGLPAWRSRYRSTRGKGDRYLLAVGKAANLSVYETRDAGLSWSPASVRTPGVDDFAERCVAAKNDRSFTFSLSDDGSRTVVTSLGPDGAPFSSVLAKAQHEVVAAGCDGEALVAAVRAEGTESVALALCPYRDNCRAMELPRFSGVDAAPRFPLDLARVDGVTIVATVMHGLVRVASTRDDGGSWMPYSVAFDASAFPDFHTHVAVPGRLLALGKRVLLYGGADQPAHTYPVLVSDDYGASWRTPGR